jgi:hypothetical protein
MLNGKMDGFEWRIKNGFSSFEREEQLSKEFLKVSLFLNRARTSL